MDSAGADAAVALAEQARGELNGLDAKQWLDRLERKQSELREAFDWFVDHGRPDEAMRIAVALYDFWRITGRATEGRQLIGAALPGVKSGALRAQAMYRRALLAFWQGDDETARSSLEESLEIARRLNDATAIAVALAGLARVELRLGNLENAHQLSAEALRTVEGTDDKEGRQNALHVLAVTAQMRGDLVEARELMTQRLELARQVGNFGGAAVEANNLSHVERRLGNLGRAELLANEALQIAQRRGDDWITPYALSAVAACAAQGTKFGRAARLLGAAEAMVEAQRVAWPPDERPLFEETKKAAADALGAVQFESAFSQGKAMQPAEAVSYALQPNSRPDLGLE